MRCMADQKEVKPRFSTSTEIQTNTNMYRLVLTNTCKSTYTSSERLTKREKIDMKMNMNQQLTFGMRNLLHE